MSNRYDCTKCPGYCCSYDTIPINKRDAKRLAKHLDLDVETLLDRHTRISEGGETILKHQPDEIYGSICGFLDLQTRRCTVYEARPSTCREYPEFPSCGYYNFLTWERRQQGDDDFVPHGSPR
jgi:Fe-S-cluster containining protein